MAGKSIGRSVQKFLRESMADDREDWDVIVPKKQTRKVCDILIEAGELKVMVKVKTTRGDAFRYSTFSEQQLDIMHRFVYRRKGNLAIMFLYFASHSSLVAVDIEELLSWKANSLHVDVVKEYGYAISTWEQFDRYLQALSRLRTSTVFRRRRCTHHWLIESLEGAFLRTNKRKYSMGYCKHCGAVKLDFNNRLEIPASDVPMLQF